MPAHREFYEQRWRRSDLPILDAAWKKLSVEARNQFLTEVKLPYRAESQYAIPFTSAPFKKGVIEELVEAQLIDLWLQSYRQSGTATAPSRYVLAPRAYGFATRLQMIAPFDLEKSEDLEVLTRFFDIAIGYSGVKGLEQVLTRAKVGTQISEISLVNYLIRSRSWPDWVAGVLKNKVAEKILKVLDEAQGPLDPDALLSLASPKDLNAGREALSQLIGFMAVVEGLEPETKQIQVGLLPTVKQRRALWKGADPSKRPALDVCESPTEFAPQTGLLISDLREFLIGLTGQPIRLKNDSRPFAKELTRVADSFEPWPGWLEERIGWNPETRAVAAIGLAVDLKFALPEGDVDDRLFLRGTKQGNTWLGDDLESQGDHVYRSYQRIRGSQRGTTDEEFYGKPVCVVPKLSKKPRTFFYGAFYVDTPKLSAEEIKTLRLSILKALKRLPLGEYVVLESVIRWLSHPSENPLLMGKPVDKLEIYLENRSIPSLDEAVEYESKQFFMYFFEKRLIPFDAVQTARDSAGRICIARTTRLDRYFGESPTEKMPKSLTAGPTKVVVQPDFSVVIIGLDQSPVIELAPFCERVQGRAGHGALSYKITRESIVKAVSGGMKGEEILERLQRHASVALPDSVVRQVSEWSNWTKVVTAEPLLVYHCGDSDTADRVQSALGKTAVRLGPNHVGITSGKLNAADRQKLISRGIIVSSSRKTPSKSVKKPKRR